MARRWARRIERYCCGCLTYFPLVFVYGLTTWALWVVVSIGSFPTPEGAEESWTGKSMEARFPFSLLFWFSHLFILVLRTSRPRIPSGMVDTPGHGTITD